MDDIYDASLLLVLALMVQFMSKNTIEEKKSSNVVNYARISCMLYNRRTLQKCIERKLEEYIDEGEDEDIEGERDGISSDVGGRCDS